MKETTIQNLKEMLSTSLINDPETITKIVDRMKDAAVRTTIIGMCDGRFMISDQENPCNLGQLMTWIGSCNDMAREKFNRSGDKTLYCLARIEAARRLVTLVTKMLCPPLDISDISGLVSSNALAQWFKSYLNLSLLGLLRLNNDPAAIEKLDDIFIGYLTDGISDSDSVGSTLCEAHHLLSETLYCDCDEYFGQKASDNDGLSVFDMNIDHDTVCEMWSRLERPVRILDEIIVRPLSSKNACVQTPAKDIADHTPPKPENAGIAIEETEDCSGENWGCTSVDSGDHRSKPCCGCQEMLYTNDECGPYYDDEYFDVWHDDADDEYEPGGWGSSYEEEWQSWDDWMENEDFDEDDIDEFLDEFYGSLESDDDGDDALLEYLRSKDDEDND